MVLQWTPLKNLKLGIYRWTYKRLLMFTVSPCHYRAVKAVQLGAGMDDRSIVELIIYLGMEINVKGHLIRDQCVEVLSCFSTRVHV